MCFRFLHSWARKMTQKERAIGTLQKGSGTISTTHMVLATVCNSSPGDPMHTPVWQTDMKTKHLYR